MRKLSTKETRSSEDLRKDASNNRQTLIVTAWNLFKEKGAEISLTEVAKEAKVSRMTFYRNFPDKSALVEAVFHYNLDLLEESTKSIGLSDTSFFELLSIVMHQQIEYHALIPFLSTEDRLLQERLIDLFSPHVTRAITAGKLRTDFHVSTDVELLLMIVGGALTPTSQDPKKQALRAMELIVEGLKPQS